MAKNKLLSTSLKLIQFNVHIIYQKYGKGSIFWVTMPLDLKQESVSVLTSTTTTFLWIFNKFSQKGSIVYIVGKGWKFIGIMYKASLQPSVL